MTETTQADFLPLAQPVIEAEELDAVREVFADKQLALGKRTLEFESRFADFLGVPFASAVSSGTAGLHLALRGVGVSEGDEVVTSPFSFIASANAPLYERARAVFADIDPHTLNLDPDAAASVRTERTAAVLPVHVFGYPADTPTFEKWGLPIVEDACEALGARHGDGLAVGARGHPAVFGFYPNKQLTTGEGGMVTTSDAGLKRRFDSERNQGRKPDAEEFEHETLGFNYRLDELSAAVGVAQLGRLDHMLAQRARVAQTYRDLLSDVEGLGLPCEDHDGNRRGWFVFVVQVPHGVSRDATMEGLRRNNIQTRAYLPAIHLTAFYREQFGYKPGQFPVCEDIAQRSLALPFFPGLRESDCERVAETLKAALKAARDGTAR